MCLEDFLKGFLTGRGWGGEGFAWSNLWRRRKLRYKRLLNSAKQTVWQKFRKKIKNDMSDMRKFNISYVNFIAKVII